MPLGGQFAVAPLGMDGALERIERDLAHHRVDHVLDLAGEQRLALLGAAGLRQQPLEGQHLAEHAGGFRQCQRRRRHQRAVLGRQHLMHAVAEFMGERHHVARLALIIHQHIRMRRRRGRMRECARRLAGPHRRIDPAIGEKPLGDAGHFRREAAIGRQHHVPGVGPGDTAGGGERQRRVAIPMREFLLFEPARPSADNSDATAADRPRAPNPPAHRRPRARRGCSRWRESATSWKPRQRSEISLSLASVLVMSAKVRSLALKVFASACPAALRFSPARSCSRFSVGSIASSLPPTLKRRPEMVWSNSRFQAA